MEDFRHAAACCILGISILGIGIFYVFALAMNPEVSQIPCGKVMWYTLCIQTAVLMLSIPVILNKRPYKKKQHEQLNEQPKNLQNQSHTKPEQPENLQQPKDPQTPQDPEEFYSGLASWLACLADIGMLEWLACLILIVFCVDNALLLEQVLNISFECQAQIEGYRLFWHAAQFQAYAFLSILCFTAGFFLCFGCCMMCFCIYSKNGGAREEPEVFVLSEQNTKGADTRNKTLEARRIVL